MTIVVFLITFSLLVLAHEWGHFLSARALGIAVEEFGLGFPPRLASVRRDRTLFSINLIPLGGFVRLKGESSQTNDPDDFGRQRIGRRALVIVSGVAMNVLLAYVLTVVLLLRGVAQDISQLPSHGFVRDPHVEIAAVLEDSPAGRVRVPPGSTIVSVNGIPASSIEAIQQEIRSHKNTPVDVAVRSPEGQQLFSLIPVELSTSPPIVGIGVQLVWVGTVSYPFVPALTVAGRIITSQTILIIKSLGNLLKEIVVVQKLPSSVTGPVGIAVLVGQASRSGWDALLQLMSILSLNLAVLNILPIPALDGGRLVFLAAEAIIRRPVRLRVEAMIHQVGFIALLGLILLVTLRDIETLLLMWKS